jgi:hypothetical protein
VLSQLKTHARARARAHDMWFLHRLKFQLLRARAMRLKQLWSAVMRACKCVQRWGKFCRAVMALHAWEKLWSGDPLPTSRQAAAVLAGLQHRVAKRWHKSGDGASYLTHGKWGLLVLCRTHFLTNGDCDLGVVTLTDAAKKLQCTDLQTRVRACAVLWEHVLDACLRVARLPCMAQRFMGELSTTSVLQDVVRQCADMSFVEKQHQQQPKRWPGVLRRALALVQALVSWPNFRPGAAWVDAMATFTIVQQALLRSRVGWACCFGQSSKCRPDDLTRLCKVCQGAQTLTCGTNGTRMSVEERVQFWKRALVELVDKPFWRQGNAVTPVFLTENHVNDVLCTMLAMIEN